MRGMNGREGSPNPRSQGKSHHQLVIGFQHPVHRKGSPQDDQALS